MTDSRKSDFDVETVDWTKTGGLVPAVVQHPDSGLILMLAYMNRPALEQTLRTGKVTFYSRTRNCIWTKGETSGNSLNLAHVELDCDGDTLLVLALPDGPVCHRNTETCFSPLAAPLLSFLARLTETVQHRRSADPESSYTAKLLSQPLHRIAQKVGEEALETALAAVQRDDDALIDEAADLIFHLLVLLEAKEVAFKDVVLRLASRHRAAAAL